MECEEVAAIRNFRRQLEFPRLKWLDKAKFEEYLREKRPIYPYMMPAEDDKATTINLGLEEGEDDEYIDKRMFIGRSIDTHTSEGALYGFDHNTETHMRLNLELVGTVSCSHQSSFPNVQHNHDNRNTTNRLLNSNKQSWKLSICSSNKVYEIYQNFMVLCFDSENLFEWKNCAVMRPFASQYYPHPVGACVDRTSDDFAYIGRVIDRPQIPNHFGQACMKDKEFNGVVDGAEFTSHEFEVLCLKPSPGKLKVQCREAIRALCDHSNERIDALVNELPRRLVDYLKYGSYVAVGDCLLRGEKLVSYDQSFELEIKKDSGMAYRPLKNGRELIKSARPVYDKIKKFKCCYYNYFEDQNPFRDVMFTYPSVESIWLLSNKIVAHLSDGKTRVMNNFVNEIQLQKYLLTFDSFTMLENFLNNTSSNVFRRKTIKAC